MNGRESLFSVNASLGLGAIVVVIHSKDDRRDIEVSKY